MLSTLLLLACQGAPPSTLPVAPLGARMSDADRASVEAGIRAYVRTYGPLSTPGASLARSASRRTSRCSPTSRSRAAPTC